VELSEPAPAAETPASPVEIKTRSISQGVRASSFISAGLPRTTSKPTPPESPKTEVSESEADLKKKVNY